MMPAACRLSCNHEMIMAASGEVPPLQGPRRGGGSPGVTSQRSDARGRPAYDAISMRQAETSHRCAAKTRQEMSYLGMECCRHEQSPARIGVRRGPAPPLHVARCFVRPAAQLHRLEHRRHEQLVDALLVHVGVWGASDTVGEFASGPFQAAMRRTSTHYRRSASLVCVRYCESKQRLPDACYCRALTILGTRREVRVVARASPRTQALSRTTFRAAAVATCCRWVLASPT